MTSELRWDACIQLLHAHKDVKANLGKQFEIWFEILPGMRGKMLYFVSLSGFVWWHRGRCSLMTSSEEDDKQPNIDSALSLFQCPPNSVQLLFHMGLLAVLKPFPQAGVFYVTSGFCSADQSCWGCNKPGKMKIPWRTLICVNGWNNPQHPSPRITRDKRHFYSHLLLLSA